MENSKNKESELKKDNYKNKEEKRKEGIAKNTFKFWITSIFAAIASYLFFFFMARMLSQEDYGLLYSLVALLYLFSVPTETIRFVISRYVTIYKTKEKLGEIKNLFKRSMKKILLYSLFCLIVIAIIAPLWLSNFLRVDIKYLLLIALSVPFLFLIPVLQGTLQGLKRFMTMGIYSSAEMFLRLIIALALVFIGLGVSGAIISIPASLFISIIIGFILLADILRIKEKRIESEPIYGYFFPFLLAIFFLTTMSSVDVLIARHFFSPVYAGFYSAISTLGTILFFISVGVGKVMFPLVSEKHHLKEEKEHKELLYKSLFLVTLPSAIWVLLLILFPKFIVGIVLGSKYLAIAGFIKYEAIAMGLLALSNVLSLYNLAIDKKKFVFLPAIFCGLEILLLSLFHGSLTQYLRMLILVNLLLFVFLLVSSVNLKDFFMKTRYYLRQINFKKSKKSEFQKV